jgi:hypothetical protein
MSPVRRPTKLAKARRAAGRMNGYESDYEKTFLMQKPHMFEAVTLKLADDCRYTPDFMVIADDDVVEFHEVKGGFWRDDAKVKIRVAAQMYPMFRFYSFFKEPKKLGGRWTQKTFSREDAA